MQTKRQSLYESCINVISGMVIAFLISQGFVIASPFIDHYLFPFHFSLDISSNIIVTITLTIVSVLRGYVWRRHFNRKHGKR